jgi:hypothetical protein
MQQIHLSEIKDLVEYEKARDAMRARVIELKKNRRVPVGDNLTFLFENRDTVLFQVQEMVRTERIVDEARIQEEIDAYDALIPGPGELSATLFIEIPDLARMSNDEVRRTINRFHGLAAANPPGTLGSFSPFGRTNPPNGNQLKVKRVPCHVNNVIAPGVGRPIPNSSTSILQRRAAIK